jgi:hypothetical protein
LLREAVRPPACIRFKSSRLCASSSPTRLRSAWPRQSKAPCLYPARRDRASPSDVRGLVLARRRRADTERMSRPPLEAADIVRCAGKSFIECSRKWITRPKRKGFARYDTLPNCCAGWTSRSVLGLRACCHLLQLVSEVGEAERAFKGNRQWRIAGSVATESPRFFLSTQGSAPVAARSSPPAELGTAAPARPNGWRLAQRCCCPLHPKVEVLQCATPRFRFAGSLSQALSF